MLLLGNTSLISVYRRLSWWAVGPFILFSVLEYIFPQAALHWSHGNHRGAQFWEMTVYLSSYALLSGMLFITKLPSPTETRATLQGSNMTLHF